MSRTYKGSRNIAPLDTMLPTPPSTSMKVKSPVDSEGFQLPGPLLENKSSPELPSRRSTTQPKRRNHSDIERRRRVKINGKYDELRQLVPSCAGFRFAKRGGDSGLHKLDILSEAVEYIKQLQSQVDDAHTKKMHYAVPSSVASETAVLRAPDVTRPILNTQLPSPQLIALASEAEKLAPLPVSGSQRSSIANLLN